MDSRLWLSREHWQMVVSVSALCTAIFVLLYSLMASPHSVTSDQQEILTALRDYGITFEKDAITGIRHINVPSAPTHAQLNAAFHRGVGFLYLVHSCDLPTFPLFHPHFPVHLDYWTAYLNRAEAYHKALSCKVVHQWQAEVRAAALLQLPLVEEWTTSDEEH